MRAIRCQFEQTLATTLLHEWRSLHDFRRQRRSEANVGRFGGLKRGTRLTFVWAIEKCLRQRILSLPLTRELALELATHPILPVFKNCQLYRRCCHPARASKRRKGVIRQDEKEVFFIKKPKSDWKNPFRVDPLESSRWKLYQWISRACLQSWIISDLWHADEQRDQLQWVKRLNFSNES